MRPQDRELAQKLDAGLRTYEQIERRLPGIRARARRETLLEQLVESIRRVRYIAVLRTQEMSDRCMDPSDELFDPLKAAILSERQGNLDEAFWLVFLSVHFGKHSRAGWRYAREVYGRLNDGLLWDWENISNDPSGFRKWLDDHQADLKRDGVPRGFGNHRKYQSLDAYSANGTGASIASYIIWVNPPRTHQMMFNLALQEASEDPCAAFEKLYQSMDTVRTFGRMARFDYLTMVGKLGLALIRPGSAYLQGSTGPLAGAKLLFGGRITAALSPIILDIWLIELDGHLNVGMQVLEDAICNWQKSPDRFQAFRG